MVIEVSILWGNAWWSSVCQKEEDTRYNFLWRSLYIEQLDYCLEWNRAISFASLPWDLSKFSFTNRNVWTHITRSNLNMLPWPERSHDSSSKSSNLLPHILAVFSSKLYGISYRRMKLTILLGQYKRRSMFERVTVGI